MKVKCLDCENLLQQFMCPCNGEIREPKDFEKCTELLNPWDFTCDEHEITLSRADIETERECQDFKPIQKEGNKA